MLWEGGALIALQGDEGMNGPKIFFFGGGGIVFIFLVLENVLLSWSGT